MRLTMGGYPWRGPNICHLDAGGNRFRLFLKLWSIQMDLDCGHLISGNQMPVLGRSVQGRIDDTGRFRLATKSLPSGFRAT